MDLLVVLLMLAVVLALFGGIRICVHNDMPRSYGGSSIYRCSLPPENPIPPSFRNDIFGGVCLACGQKIDWKMWDCIKVEEIKGGCGCLHTNWYVDSSTYKPVRKRVKNETS